MIPDIVLAVGVVIKTDKYEKIQVARILLFILYSKDLIIISLLLLTKENKQNLKALF